MFGSEKRNLSKTCEQFVIESISSQLEIINSLEKTVKEHKSFIQHKTEVCNEMHEWRSKRKFIDSVTRIASRAINLALSGSFLYTRSPISIFSTIVSGGLLTDQLLKNRISRSLSNKSTIVEAVCAASCVIASAATSSSPMSVAGSAFSCGFTSFVSGMSLYADKCKHKIIKCEMQQEKADGSVNNAVDAMKKSSKAVTNMIACDAAALACVKNMSNKQIEALETILSRLE